MQKPYYVYTLIDPRSGAVFYVGKGQGNRMHSHAREAERNVCTSNRRKIEFIRKMQADGHQPIPVKVAEYFSEKDAIEHEAELISKLPNLFNVLARGWYGQFTADEIARREEARALRVFEAQNKRALPRMRKWLQMVDSWGDKVVWYAPGVKGGEKAARDLISYVRSWIAREDAQLNNG